MAWRKIGQVFDLASHKGQFASHAQIPTCLVTGERIAVFFSSRDAEGRSHIRRALLDAEDPSRVLSVSDDPLISLGRPGSYDEFGLMPSAVLPVGDEVWLYTIGWQRGATVPYINAIGLLVSRDGGETFKRPFDGPILDRTSREPYSTMSPFVLRDPSGKFTMWYGSGTDWIAVGGKYEPIYVIKRATSHDGLRWERDGTASLPSRHDDEASTRPTVLRDGDGFRMWFSHRRSVAFRGGEGSYRMGYATSQDGIVWARNDDAAGIGLGLPGAWDREMMAYPSVVQARGATYLFYNGNAFGRHGFGCAVWEN